jgi:hypothetical protein
MKSPTSEKALPNIPVKTVAKFFNLNAAKRETTQNVA